MFLLGFDGECALYGYPSPSKLSRVNNIVYVSLISKDAAKLLLSYHILKKPTSE